MKRVLITAFEPYDVWSENSSWLALMSLVRDLPKNPTVTTRRYPVEFSAVKEKLEQDLAADFDVALHLGQAPGSTAIALESIGVNVGGLLEEPAEAYLPLAEGGPVAYRSALPLADWAARLAEEGIPGRVSYHAGTFLCNATLYWSHYLAERLSLKTRAAFIHLPLDTSQTIGQKRPMASLPTSLAADALGLILEEIARAE